jgi:hypothetical protein
VIGGFTGVLAERVGWFWFFICATGLGLPAIGLAIVLAGSGRGSSPASR